MIDPGVRGRTGNKDRFQERRFTSVKTGYRPRFRERFIYLSVVSYRFTGSTMLQPTCYSPSTYSLHRMTGPRHRI